MADLNLNVISYQDPVRSKPIRENFSDIQNAVNDLQTQINELTTPPEGSEVTNARDNADVLRDRLRGASLSQGNVVISGGEVTAQGTPDMTVHIAAGTALVNGIYCNWAAQDSGTITAPSTYPRYDLVVANSDNSISILTGDEAASPIPPSYSSSQKEISFIYLTTATTSIIDSVITDAKRILKNTNDDIIVGDTGQYSTIQEAVNYCKVKGYGVIKIQEGTYTEDLDLAGCENIYIYGCGDKTIIYGTILCNNTSSTKKKNVYLYNFKMTNSALYSIDVTSDYTDIHINSIYFNSEFKTTIAISHNCDTFSSVENCYIVGHAIETNIIYGAGKCLIKNNTMPLGKISVSADYSIIDGNTLTGGDEDHIVVSSNNCSVINNNSVHAADYCSIRQTGNYFSVIGNRCSGDIILSGIYGVCANNLCDDISSSSPHINICANQGDAITITAESPNVTGNYFTAYSNTGGGSPELAGNSWA
jgi:hypothetical protein